MSEMVREQISNAADAAKNQAKNTYEKQKGRALNEIGTLASALRRASDGLDRGSISSTVIDRAAGTLENVSRSIQGKDLDTLVHDVQSFGRRNPAVFLGVAAALGFVAARFAKSSSRDLAYGDDEGGAYEQRSS
jgi:MinD superfamily P-loop ATPase